MGKHPFKLSVGEILRSIAFSATDRLRGNEILCAASDAVTFYNDVDKHLATREQRLQDLLQYVVEEVPFYSDYQGCPFEIWPVIDKDAIREDSARFRSRTFEISKLLRVTTSGSSGQPFECFHEREKVRRKLADILYYNQRVGYSVGMRHMLIRATKKPRWKLFLQNEVWVDPTHWDESFREKIRKTLLNDSIKVAIGYPSVMADLADFCLSKGDAPADLGLKAYIATSEVISPQQRDLIRETFQCEIASRYATEEFGVVGQSGGDCRRFEMNINSLIVELLKVDEDKPVPAGEVGRVVVTDLFMRQMPLIRYDTGDLATAAVDNRVSIGVSALEALEGKTADVIFDTRGERVAPLSVLVAFKDFKGVRQFQFAQVSGGVYALRISPESADIDTGMEAKLRTILGADARIRIERMSNIPTQSSGKRPIVINEMVKKAATS